MLRQTASFVSVEKKDELANWNNRMPHAVLTDTR